MRQRRGRRASALVKGIEAAVESGSIVVSQQFLLDRVREPIERIRVHAELVADLVSLPGAQDIGDPSAPTGATRADTFG